VGVSAALAAAKRVTSRPTKKAVKKSPAKRHVATEPSASAVRAWAASNGVEVSPKGMIPKAVLMQFQEAGN
jgi:ribosomal protein L35